MTTKSISRQSYIGGNPSEPYIRHFRDEQRIMIPEFFRDYSRFIEEYNQLKTNCVRDKKHVNDIEHHIKWGGRIGQNELVKAMKILLDISLTRLNDGERKLAMMDDLHPRLREMKIVEELRIQTEPEETKEETLIEQFPNNTQCVL